MNYPSKEEIDDVFNGMPGGGRGWLTDWGYQQFAMAVLERFGNIEGSAGRVGLAGAMPGTTGFAMAVFNADDVPVGAELYEVAPTERDRKAGVRVKELESAIANLIKQKGRHNTEQGYHNLVKVYVEGLAK